MAAVRTICLLSLLFAGALGLTVSKTSKSAKWRDGKEKGSIQGTNRPVFYTIIMGPLAFRHQVSLWLSSLRKLGEYKEEVVIVTDKPACLARTLNAANLLGSMLSSNEDVDIYRPAKGYEGNIHLLKRPTQKFIFKMKMEKTRAWINVRNARLPREVSSVIHTDEDIVFGKSLNKFMGILHQIEQESHTLALFEDKGTTKGQLHTGVVVMFPGEQTDKCLVSWSKHLHGVTQEAINNGRKHVFREAINEEGLKISMKNDIDQGEDASIEEAGTQKVAIENEAKEATTQQEALEVDSAEDMSMDLTGPDQRALEKSIACGSDKTSLLVLPESFLWFPDAKGLLGNDKAEFIHFTNTNRYKKIDHTLISQYLTNLGIPSMIDPMGEEADHTCDPAYAPQGTPQKSDKSTHETDQLNKRWNPKMTDGGKKKVKATKK